ncbi:thyrotropin-releasing hormone-degrading ectoenzyme [Diachasma alloeum]|uniref:thyrotropin-releasing hormone-degrading ectoenzyme n=1 Tax=Diachasma alloeum TaxID=454923 RepID=UPI0007385099|nr:thyrotropin-releasing hormone-degrading ectoenzyme [Diachasma alloeum]
MPLSSSSAPYSTMIDEDELMQGVTGFRLPNSTAPRLYVLNLEPHIDDDKFTFDGDSNTVFEVLSPTTSVTLHAFSSMEINEIYTSLQHSNGAIEKPISQRFNSSLEFFNVRFNHTLIVGNYTLRLKWRGNGVLNDGFYRGTYTDINGITRYIAVTCFEPFAARKAFPCWDEPAFKAQYEITLLHYGNYTALSNMPIKEETSAEDRKIWTTFERSPVMSTYLATFVLTQYTNHVNEHGNVTFWVRPEKLKSTALISEMTPRIVQALEDYTAIPYFLPKLDSIVMEEYFVASSEHWGLISYSKYILYDLEVNKLSERNTALVLAAHEITHQWLGNLVTPAWWNDIWLSEGVTEYLSHSILDIVMPNSHFMDVFVISTITDPSFGAEETEITRLPVRWMPSTPEDVWELFSPVTYNKGAAITRMLAHVVTEEAFRDGVRKYLEKNKFRSVVTDDLWESLQESYNEKQIVPHLNIKEIMDPWLEQPGYPLLNVTRDYDIGVITIIQSDGSDSGSNNLWTIPLNYATTSRPDFSSTRPTHFMRDENFILDGIDRNDWIILNIQKTGEHDYDLLMDMIAYLYRETNPLPWIVMEKLLKTFSECSLRIFTFNTFKRYALHLMDNMIKEIGFKDRSQVNDNLVQLARIGLLPWACELGHKECKAIAPIKLMEILNSKTNKSLIADHRDWIYRTALTDANESLWDQVMESHWKHPREHNVFKYLGYSNNHTLLEKYLPLAMAKNATLLSTDLYDALISMAMGPRKNYNFGLNFFINNVDMIRQYLKERNYKGIFKHLCHTFSRQVKTQRQKLKVTNFLHKLLDDGKLRKIAPFLESAEKSMICMEKSSQVFHEILAKNSHFINFIRNENSNNL